MLDLSDAISCVFARVHSLVPTDLLTACYFIQLTIREFDYLSIYLRLTITKKSSQPAEELVKEITN